MKIRKILSTALILSFALLFLPRLSEARTGEVTFAIEIAAPPDSRDARLWVPYPVSEGSQKIEDVRIAGNYTGSGVYRDFESGSMVLYAEWKKPVKRRRLMLSFIASATETVKKEFPPDTTSIPVEVGPYLSEGRFIPTGGKVRETAVEAAKGRDGIGAKARAIYDWVVENTHRDPRVRGCGTGDVERMLAERGGKCADISSVFVALARAVGVPAREVFGLRLGRNPREDITGAHHCWAEFYYPGYGWVPVDPADVRKAMLTEGLDLKSARKRRDYFYGAVDGYRIILGKGGAGGMLTPPQKGGPLHYFMYPYAEVDGKALDWLGQKGLRYSITFKEME